MAAWTRAAVGIAVSAFAALAPPSMAGGANRGAEDPARAAAPAASPVSPRETRTIAMELLGRPPMGEERERWAALARAELVDALCGTQEFWQRWLEEQLYYFLLINNFRPRGERIESLPVELHAERLDVRSALHRIALSSSFEQRNPGADTFVTVVLEQIAGLDVRRVPRDLDIGKKVYDGADGLFLGQRGATQADIVRIAVDSPQAARHFLAREHLRLVHAEAPTKELAGWSARFEKDPRSYAALVREWLASDAYARRLERGAPQENRMFVRALFVDLLGRVPTQDEAEPLREALDALADPAPLRSVVVRLLLDSGKVALPERKDIPDAGAWVDGWFERCLARAPSASERQAFVDALADPACRPQTVVQAIVASAEYARY